MTKSIKPPITFRMNQTTLDILHHTADRGGVTATQLMEQSILFFCAYLNHIHKGTPPQ